jgi:hypothetical protein
MEYVSDDEEEIKEERQDNAEDVVMDEEKGKGKAKETEEVVVAETEHREERLETEDAPGVEAAVREQKQRETVSNVTVGRKEARRGAKRRKGKR